VDHQHHRRGRPGHDRGLGDGQTREDDLESLGTARIKSGRVLASVEKVDGRRFLNELPIHQEAHARAVTSIAR
jgi:hypothetical protein